MQTQNNFYMSSFNIAMSSAKQPTLKLYMTVLICRSSFADHSFKNHSRSIMIILRRHKKEVKTSLISLSDWSVRSGFLAISESDHKTSLFGRFQFPTNFVFCYNHGYKNLAKQSSWRSILFCVHDHIHWSKTAAMFTQFLPSLLERDSTNEWPPWYHYMPGM